MKCTVDLAAVCAAVSSPVSLQQRGYKAQTQLPIVIIVLLLEQMELRNGQYLNLTILSLVGI